MAIKDGNTRKMGRQEIGNYFVKHFEELYSTLLLTFPPDLEGLGETLVLENDNLELMKIPTPKEIKLAIWDLHSLKSAKPDGFSSIFYIAYWKVIQTGVVNFVQEVFRLRTISPTINGTFIVLIPKVKHSLIFDHFRPISLCNFSYKIVAKIITARMKGIMKTIISPHQGAFVERWWIA